MTNRERVRRSLARSKRQPAPAELAKRLRIDAGQVRRIYSELGLTKRRATPATSIPAASVDVQTTEEIQERIATYLAETASTDPISMELLRDEIQENMTRGPHPVADVVLVLNDLHKEPRPRGWFRPIDLSRELGAKQSTVRDALVKLREQGRADHDSERPVSAGRWRMIDRPAGYDEGDVLALIPSDRAAQDRHGIRKYEDPATGIVYVVVYDPDKHYGGPSGAKSHHRKIASVDGDDDGRSLALSLDGGRWIPVLSTPIHRIVVVDRDDGPDAYVEPGALAFAPTPRGHHAYLPAHLSGERQDPVYLTLSQGRGAWHERLYNADGSRRSPPRPVSGTILGGEFARHWAAFIEAQATAERMRYA